MRIKVVKVKFRVLKRVSTRVRGYYYRLLKAFGAIQNPAGPFECWRTAVFGEQDVVHHKTLLLVKL